MEQGGVPLRVPLLGGSNGNIGGADTERVVNLPTPDGPKPFPVSVATIVMLDRIATQLDEVLRCLKGETSVDQP